MEPLIQLTPLKRLFWGIGLLLAGIFAAYTWVSWRSVSQDAEHDLSYIDSLFRQSTQDFYQHQESMLRLLGERLRDMGAVEQPERGRELVDQLIRVNKAMAGFGLLRKDGQLVLVSNVPAGRQLPNLLRQPVSAVGFMEAVNSNQMIPGRTYFLPLLRSWLIPIRLSVRDTADEVVLLMTAGIDIDSPYTPWNAMELPGGVVVGLLRDDGHWQYRGGGDIGSRQARYEKPVMPEFLRAVQAGGGRHHRFTATMLEDGVPRIGVTSYLPDYGLHSVAMMPEGQLHEAFREKMRLPSVLFLAVFAGLLLVGRYTVRRQRENEEQLVYQAHHDPVTGLPNRVLVRDRLQQTMALAEHSHNHFAAFYLDLDHFQRVNDSFGHAAGDMLLRQCAERIKRTLRHVDTLGRLGGDEFLVIHADLDNPEVAETLAARMLRLFEEPFQVAGREVFTSASLGVAVYPQDGGTPEDILRNADAALNRAKETGRNSYSFFTSAMNQEAKRRISLDTGLRHAISRGELYLNYQPQVDLVTGGWSGAEALVRWCDPDMGEISPAEFIPIAEESDLIHDIGWFVLETAVADMRRALALAPDFRMSVNVSVKQLRRPGFIDDVLGLLERAQIPSRLLELEVTESVLAEGPEGLNRLRNAGVRLAVDDFGTGFSSLSYLKRFPVTTLKVDRSFIKDLETDPADAAITSAIIAMADGLALEVVAEGVETEAQEAFLVQRGCPVAQGFRYSRPTSVDALLDGLNGKARKVR